MKKICKKCKKEFITKRKLQKYCSKICKQRARWVRKFLSKVKRGKIKIISNTIIYKEIILSFLGNKCSICNSKKILHIHHKISKKLGGNNHFSNIIILCDKCHKKVHLENKLERFIL